MNNESPPLESPPRQPAPDRPSSAATKRSDPSRPRVLFLHTGGTLSMVRKTQPGPLEPEQYDRYVLPYVRGLEDVAQIDGRVVASIDSSDMQPALWERLAELIARVRTDYDGFVVLHGTDTMAYTAAALSFMLQGLDRPVILTGSQRPITEVRTDARSNLAHSAMCATMDIPEVGLFFGDRLFRGNRASKVSIQAYDAFASPNFPPLLEVGVDVRPHAQPLRPTGPFAFKPGFSSDVAALHVIPGTPARTLRAVVEAGSKAVILLALGEGNVPLSGWPDAIRQATDAGVPVVIASQSRSGWARPGRYQGSAAAAAAGATFAGDHTIEAAIVKAMWLLGQHVSADRFREVFNRPVAGECSELSSDLPA